MAPLPPGPRPTSYRHLCEIASGGMGRVYVALKSGDVDQHLYAVKRLHPHLRDDSHARHTLRDEAILAGGISHPNVLRVYEAGQDDDGPYLAMEYVDGVSVAELLVAVKRADEECSLQICLSIAHELALGLHAIHEQRGQRGELRQLIHRDVSPQNVLLGYDGGVHVADFGIAKGLGRVSETSTGMLKGKVGYMSPEQLRFEDPDRRSDLFALGIVLYELLAGRRLYSGSEGSEGARRILREPPPDIGDEREDTPPLIVELLFELLAKEPSARPATAAIVAERLAQSLDVLVQEEGHIRLGKYTASFFETERRDRARLLEAALRRVTQTDKVVDRFGPPAMHGRRPKRWKIKGAAIKSTIEYLQRLHGEEAYRHVTERLSDSTREQLSRQVLVSNWYDGAVMVELTEAAEELFSGEGSVAEQIGVASAEYAFGAGGPYEIFRTKGLLQGMEPFMNSSGEIYRLYYDVGEWEVLSWSTKGARIRVHDGGVFPDPIVRRIAGYLRRGFELIGAKDVEVDTQRDGDSFVIDARWPEGTDH